MLYNIFASLPGDKGKSLHQNILDDAPLLSVYFHVPNKKATRFNPKRVYCDCDTDDMDETAQIQYYENGKLYTVLATQEPRVPVYVVKTNERITTIKPKKIGNDERSVLPHKLLGNVNSKNFYLLGTKLKVSEELDPKVSHQKEACQRDTYKTKEGAQRIFFSRHREGWFGGGPEIPINVLHLANGAEMRLPNLYTHDRNEENIKNLKLVLQ